MALRDLLPSFYHDFPHHWQHSWEYEEAHSIQSGLHVEIDFILDHMQTKWMNRVRRYSSIKNALRAIISFCFGVNCRYPILDVLNFVKWEYELNTSIERDLQKLSDEKHRKRREE